MKAVAFNLLNMTDKAPCPGSDLKTMAGCLRFDIQEITRHSLIINVWYVICL